MNRRFLEYWGYIAELVAAMLAVLLPSIYFGVSAVTNFVRSFATDMATIVCAGVFAASIAFLVAFYSKSGTAFYRWLDEKGAFDVYRRATGFAVLVSFLSTVSMLTLKIVGGNAMALISAFLFILMLLNLYTLIQNVFGLMRLNNLFNKNSDKDN